QVGTTASDLARALRDLPGEFRTAVYLADIEGYPYREIAEMMGTPVGTVMSRLHRGRKKIREQLMASGFGTPRAASSGASAWVGWPGRAGGLGALQRQHDLAGLPAVQDAQPSVGQ